MNPLDKNGKPPLNLQHGVFSLEAGKGVAQPITPAGGAQKWETVKSPPRDALKSGLVAASAPARTSRTLLEGPNGTRTVSVNRNSSIAYDPLGRRFVNAKALPPSLRNGKEAFADRNAPGASRNNHIVEGVRNNPSREAGMRVPTGPISARATAPPSRSMTPPPAPRSSFGGAASARGGDTGFSRGSGGGGFSRGSSAPSVSAPHVSAPSGGGGGRPH